MVGFKHLVHLFEYIAVLSSGYVHGNTQWLKSRQVHKYVVEQIANVSVELFDEHSTQCNTVNTAQWVVAYKCVAFVSFFG